MDADLINRRGSILFGTLPNPGLKEMGVGLAVAVLLDATIVRGMLLRSSMKLLGHADGSG